MELDGTERKVSTLRKIKYFCLGQIFDRCASWEDPTKWVILRYPWDKDHSRVLHTLRKLRQVDVVLNRNQLGSDNGKMTCFTHQTSTDRTRTSSSHIPASNWTENFGGVFNSFISPISGHI